MSWTATRLKHVARVGYGLGQPPTLSDTGIPILRATNIMRGKFASGGLIYAAKQDLPLDRAPLLREGEILVVRSGAYTGDSAMITSAWTGSAPGYDLRVSPVSAHPAYIAYCLLSTATLDQVDLAKSRAAQPHLNAEDLGDVTLLLPPIDEQRRIVDFLDAETSRVDHLTAIRQQQSALGGQRFSLLVDGVAIGDTDALAEIEYSKGSADWSVAKVARLFAIIPGYAFASEGFVEPEAGTRLLRGINVAPGRIDWEAETAAWDLKTSPVDKRFHLRRDDLVVGMDRPWISSGTRVAMIHDIDLPSLLLQRVACIRSRSTSMTRYLRWVLRSSHFRATLEGETTGISVPHISGDQIGAFMYRLPSPDDQALLANLLQSHDDLQAVQAELFNRQLAVLAERRQALITAAVTGQIDVTTVRGGTA